MRSADRCPRRTWRNCAALRPATAPTRYADGKSRARAGRPANCCASWRWRAIVTRSLKNSTSSIGSIFPKTKDTHPPARVPRKDARRDSSASCLSRRLTLSRRPCGPATIRPRPSARQCNLEFLADVVIDRPSSAAPKEDRQPEGRPQQRVFVTPIGPEEPVRPLKNHNDDHHLDEYHRGGNAREQADRLACSGDEFTEKCQVSQQERRRQSLVADRNRQVCPARSRRPSD